MQGISAVKPFGLRLPDDLKAWIAEQAEKHGRSQNSELLQIIKAARESTKHKETK